MLSDHMLRQMVDAMPMPVFVTNESDRCIYANRAFEILFQVRADQLIDATDPVSVAATVTRLPGWQRHTTESTTFSTPSGEHLTMGMVHTETYSTEQSPEAEVLRGELRSVRAELARTRETDPVTQALSRRALRAHTEDTFSSAPAGVLRISVDDYQSVSDRFGQDMGDDLLADIGDIVRANTRPEDVFARTDESEFVLVLREADREQTAAIARRICAAATAARTQNGEPKLALSVTVGAAYSDGADTELAVLIDQAEQALRSANRCRNEAVVA